eukprot:CAMPEP_0201588122 /NCGR_PEP_ID=MMETSP0190_2-20130828/151704_1 /ASSEMBLY_ACC=CAM_ASM_000263 /TAXON_ID=37353 /ORGANISM="Rosalina sp." /LENGTH=59 /DNA_ID=CAMNT_0048039669 /DNA_START=1 /DNA_END=180 /DNA_ORIENTATION=-
MVNELRKSRSIEDQIGLQLEMGNYEIDTPSPPSPQSIVAVDDEDEIIGDTTHSSLNVMR